MTWQPATRNMSSRCEQAAVLLCGVFNLGKVVSNMQQRILRTRHPYTIAVRVQ
jgi:hypothetical protein